MDFTQITFVGLVVVTVVGALKDQFPTMTANTTRLVALCIGLVLGLLGQVGLLVVPGVTLNVVTGIWAAVAAVGVVTVADRV